MLAIALLPLFIRHLLPTFLGQDLTLSGLVDVFPTCLSASSWIGYHLLGLRMTAPRSGLPQLDIGRIVFIYWSFRYHGEAILLECLHHLTFDLPNKLRYEVTPK